MHPQLTKIPLWPAYFTVLEESVILNVIQNIQFIPWFKQIM
jgi:hypothetical protein